MSKLKKAKKPTAVKTEETHPFTSQLRGAEPVIHVSLKACKTALINSVEAFDRDLGRFGKTNAETVINAIQMIGEDGGEVDEVLDDRSGLRYRVTIRKRTTA